MGKEYKKSWLVPEENWVKSAAFGAAESRALVQPVCKGTQESDRAGAGRGDKGNRKQRKDEPSHEPRQVQKRRRALRRKPQRGWASQVNRRTGKRAGWPGDEERASRSNQYKVQDPAQQGETPSATLTFAATVERQEEFRSSVQPQRQQASQGKHYQAREVQAKAPDAQEIWRRRKGAADKGRHSDKALASGQV